LTTRSKGITLPVWANVRFTNGYFETSSAADFSSNASYKFAPQGIFPLSQVAPIAATPQSLNLQAQDANAGFIITGASVNVTPGAGSGGSSSGNLVIKDSTGAGGTWNSAHIELGTYHIWVDTSGHLRTKTSAPTSATDGLILNIADLAASAVYDPISLAAGAGVTTTVSVPGAALGDFVQTSFSLDTSGILLTSWVSAANTVSVRFQNQTGGTLDIASGTLRVRVSKQ
jgi:hypothetical protein